MMGKNLNPETNSVVSGAGLRGLSNVAALAQVGGRP